MTIKVLDEKDWRYVSQTLINVNYFHRAEQVQGGAGAFRDIGGHPPGVEFMVLYAQVRRSPEPSSAVTPKAPVSLGPNG